MRCCPAGRSAGLLRLGVMLQPQKPPGWAGFPTWPFRGMEGPLLLGVQSGEARSSVKVSLSHPPKTEAALCQFMETKIGHPQHR